LMILGFRGYVHRIGSLLANSVHLPLMAFAGSAALPTRYQLAGRIPEALQAVVSPISQTIVPQLTREAADDPKVFARSVERYSMIGLGLGISLILVPSGFGLALLQIWAKDNPALVPASSLVLLLLGIYFTFELFFIMLTKAFYALGNPHYMAPFSIFNGVATLVLTLPMVLNFGIVGVGVQNVLIDAAQLVPMLLVVRKRAAPDLNVGGQVFAVVLAMVVGSGIAAGAYWMMRISPFVDMPWIGLALVPVFSAASFFLLVGLRLVPMPEDLRKLLRRRAPTAAAQDHPA
jgi:peptidoglycan biosynthesis protein MviN/MurJ (putative lipid II flippase)